MCRASKQIRSVGRHDIQLNSDGFLVQEVHDIAKLTVTQRIIEEGYTVARVQRIADEEEARLLRKSAKILKVCFIVDLRRVVQTEARAARGAVEGVCCCRRKDRSVLTMMLRQLVEDRKGFSTGLILVVPSTRLGRVQCVEKRSSSYICSF